MVVIVLITTFSISGLGLVIGSLGLITRNIEFACNVLFFSLMIFSGANIRLETLPLWVQIISASLPLTRGIAAVRLAINGTALPDLLPLLRAELLIGLAYALAGFALFRWFEVQAKRHGALEVF
jgi:ABC-2 type transport system permease protein